MKSIKISLIIVALCCVALTAQAQKFGFVNSAALLSEMPQVKQADANLEALQKQLQKKGQGMLEQLQKDYMEIQQKVENGELSPKQQEEEAKKLEDRRNEIAAFEQDMVNQIQKKRSELLDPIMENVNKAIADVAKENGYQFIFDQQVLLYFDEAQDVSDLVKSKLGM